MRTAPKTPKLLPWLAKKAGISDIRAAALWHDAERWAAHRSAPGSSAYFKLAVDRLLDSMLPPDAISTRWRAAAPIGARRERAAELRAADKHWCMGSPRQGYESRQGSPHESARPLSNSAWMGQACTAPRRGMDGTGMHAAQHPTPAPTRRWDRHACAVAARRPSRPSLCVKRTAK